MDVDVVERSTVAANGRKTIEYELISDLRQRHIETFSNLYFAHSGETNNIYADAGNACRAAVEAGWFATPSDMTADDVGDMYPAEVTQLAKGILELYKDAVDIDPN